MLIRRAAPEDYETVGLLTEAAYEEFLEGPDDYYRAFLRDAPHVAIVPGLAIFLVVMSFNMIGDGLRDTLDPKLKRS